MPDSRERVYFLPLGCPKNQVDGELMLGQASAEGHEIVDDPDRADVLVVNTCAFIEAAREESVDAILQLAARKGDRRLVVTGCMAERYREELRREIPEIDALVGTGGVGRFTEAVSGRAAAVFTDEKHYLPAAAAARPCAATHLPAAPPRRSDEHFELLARAGLTDELGEALGPQRRLEATLVAGRLGVEGPTRTY